MKATLPVAALLLVAVASTSVAQPFCPGDQNIDDSTTVDEIVAAVDAALNGCSAPVGCPFSFTEPGEAEDCIFVGRWHPLCGGSDLEAIFVVDGEDLIVSLFNPDIDVYAEIVDPGIAFLFAWEVLFEGEEPEPIDGEVLLSDPPRVALTVFPDTIPFTISECNFERYEGRFAEVADAFFPAGGAAVDTRVTSRIAASRQHLRRLDGDNHLQRLKREAAARRQRSGDDDTSKTRRRQPQPASLRPAFKRSP
jgi:hypothetical protein